MRIAQTNIDNANHYACTLKAGAHTLTADEPVKHGGTDTGPAPYQLLLAGLAACTAITLRMVAEKKQWNVGTIHVDLEFHKDSAEHTGRITRVVSFSEKLSDEAHARMVAVVEKTPVTLTLKAGTPITTTFS
ncbi:MAG: osmotically inducible protein C [Archangium gephyra]|uniref:Osmotically inducible protein C n=1 Tax=Archangium gephyra TaxID=48 RepID=A0A2W5VPG0_9BACT|nr:MAG: osmotically inducible protein C [Archangium gephyra]